MSTKMQPTTLEGLLVALQRKVMQIERRLTRTGSSGSPTGSTVPFLASTSQTPSEVCSLASSQARQAVTSLTVRSGCDSVLMSQSYCGHARRYRVSV